MMRIFQRLVWRIARQGVKKWDEVDNANLVTIVLYKLLNIE